MGLSQTAFGKALGYHWVSINRIETGKAAISRRFVLELEKLLKGENCAITGKHRSGTVKKV